MTKSTRHKKFRKQEVKKIKLKLGKKLKGAQNETKTDFKTRKIILKEQLSVKPQSSFITKKNLNLNELLSRLAHYNATIRQDGLSGIKELVLGNKKDELAPHLSALFRGLNPCLLDTDHTIRTTAVKLVEAIILKNGAMIQPYFSPLSAYMSCAMVHMNTGVQSDSLVLMDTLLCHVPSLIGQSANAILENYFRLISRKINHKKKSSMDSYTLISNPSSELANIKWRIKLLRSLGRYLEVILSEKIKIEASVPTIPWQVVTRGCLPSLAESSTNTRASIHGAKILTDESEAETFILNLVPLLFQTLGEVEHSSDNRSEASGTPLAPITVELLRAISEIILHLWNITQAVTNKNPTQCSWFIGALRKHLANDVFAGFPYCVLESNQDKASTRDSEGKGSMNPKKLEVECHQLNVNLASLALLYLEQDSSLKAKVVRYYVDLLSNRDIASQLKLEKLVSTSCDLLKKRKISSLKLSDRLLTTSLRCYQSFPTTNKSRNLLLALPLQASEYTCKHLWKSKGLRSWMVAVVNNSVETDTLDDPVMELLLQFKLRNTPGFASILAEKKDLLQDKLKRNMTTRPLSDVPPDTGNPDNKY